MTIIRQKEGKTYYAEYDGSYLSSPFVVEVLQNPAFALSGAKILLAGQSGSVGVAGKVAIKEHKMRTFWKGVKYQYVPSRARLCWNNAHLLEECDIPTPRPIGFVEMRVGFCKKNSYYLYEYLEGADLYAILKRGGDIDDGMVDACVQLICRLEKAEIKFHDLKTSNMVISEGGPALIDIHSIKQSAFRFSAVHRRNVARFLYSLRNSQRVQERFLHSFERHGVAISQKMLNWKFAPE